MQPAQGCLFAVDAEFPVKADRPLRILKPRDLASLAAEVVGLGEVSFGTGVPGIFHEQVKALFVAELLLDAADAREGVRRAVIAGGQREAREVLAIGHVGAADDVAAVGVEP